MSDPTSLLERLSETGALQNLSPPIQTALFLGALTLVPAALVCVTSFTRIVIVLSFVRRAVTTQEIPPNSIIVGLSLFLTLFVMGPTWEEMNRSSITPYLNKEISGPEAVKRGSIPLQSFMIKQTRIQDLALFVHISGMTPPNEPADVPLHVLIPAFVISELKTAFIMGFCIYMPFLLVDLVVSSVLTSMGMMMMPPVVISAPFKLLLFVIADGWHLVARALTTSFG
jgi:flagellar biosynthesis protein FliP